MKPNQEAVNHRSRSLDDFFYIASQYHIFNRTKVTLETARHVADYWFTFSKAMPGLLVLAANNLRREEHKASLLKIAKEEAGEIDGIPHYQMFSSACRIIDVFPRNVEIECLNLLIDEVTTNFDSTILGICFGLEIIANENIQFLLTSLCISKNEYDLLDNSQFFTIHKQNEDEHIRLNYKNYEKYCNTYSERIQFETGFDYALQFWKSFWDGNLIKQHRRIYNLNERIS
jgi:hypothetical protein